MTTPSYKGCRNKLHLLMGEAAKYCGLFIFFFSLPWEAWISFNTWQEGLFHSFDDGRVTQLSQEKLKSTMEQFIFRRPIYLIVEEVVSFLLQMQTKGNARGKQYHSYPWHQAKVITEDINVPSSKLKPECPLSKWRCLICSNQHLLVPLFI